MANVLLYNIGTDKLAKLSVLFQRSGIRWRVVAPEEYSLPICMLSSPRSDPLPGISEEGFTDELLLMNDFTRVQLNGLLDGLRRMKISIPLKAIVTETNAVWSSLQLHRELCAEREAMEKGQRVHSTN